MLKSRWLWTAAGVALLVGAYALFGFRLLPGLLRTQAIDYVQRTYGRELRIGAVSVQPFRLQLEVRDLAFPDRDRQPMLGFERLFVDFEIASLWRRAWVFRELAVDGPAVRAVLRRDGSLNLADLAPPPPPGAAPRTDEPATLPSLWIEALAIRAGSVEYVELARRRKAFARRFEPVGFTLRDFRTTPEGGAFRLAAQSGDGERFDWRGRFALAPGLASEGEFTIGGLRASGVAEFLGDTLPFDVSDGLIDLGGSYRVALGADTRVELEVPRVMLSRLALRARGVDTDWVTVPELELTDTRLALPANQVAVRALTLRGMRASAWVEPDGSVNLARLVAPTADAGPPAGEAQAEPAAAPAAGAAPAPAPDPVAAPDADAAGTASAGRPWSVSLARLELAGAQLDLEDRMKAPVKRFEIAPLELRVESLSLALDRPLPLELTATINDHATLRVGGSVVPRPFAAELDVALQRARMQILQPYVLPVADLTILGGTLGVNGRLRLAPGGGAAPALEFAGEAGIDDFRSIDNAMREELVSFKRLQLRKLRFTQSPDALAIDSVRLAAPYARVIIGREQILNIAAVLDPAGTAAELAKRRAKAAALAAESRAARRAREREERRAAQARQKAAKLAARRGGATSTAAATPAPPEETGMPVRIREVRIEDGRMNFSDLSIQPNFSAEVLRLGGAVTGLSSAFSSRATIDLKGQVDEFSPVTIGGTIQPFAFDRFSDVKLRFENISLPVFNPYSGRFAGYNIAKGKLTTDLRYQIDRRKLNASHKIRIDQLEWGEASAVRGEATLPVKFATALLKDRDGVIQLDVPVTGTLDDPKLRIGPIVWQIIRNLIVKAVTAPFALLGALFAGAEEAQFVDFRPGEATLEPAIAERLAALARGLAQKQGISLDVPIMPVPALDAPALVEQRYLAQRALALAAALGRKEGDAAPLPEFDTLPARQRIAVLERMLRAQGGEAPRPPPPPEPPAGASRAEARAAAEAAQLEWLDAATRRGIVLADDALAALGRERAAAIQRALLAAGELEASRVFVVNEGKVDAQDGKVRLQLALK